MEPDRIKGIMMRHYGIMVGDRVRDRFNAEKQPGCESATVIFLYPTNNNRVKVRNDSGEEYDMVAEWCEVILNEKQKREKWMAEVSTKLEPVMSGLAEKRIAIGDALFLGYLIGMQDSVTMSNEQRRYFMAQLWYNPFGLKDYTV